jgi:hypothetical protein
MAPLRVAGPAGSTRRSGGSISGGSNSDGHARFRSRRRSVMPVMLGDERARGVEVDGYDAQADRTGALMLGRIGHATVPAVPVLRSSTAPGPACAAATSSA